MAGNHHPSPPLFFHMLSHCRWLLLPITIIVLSQLQFSQAQQSYVNNKQLQCEQNYTTTLGYTCSNTTSPSSCASYITFRSTPTYNSPTTIGYLLNADASEIARLNNISDIATIPTNTLVIIPVNCSCSSAGGGQYYQHDASYRLKVTGETYFSVSNNTYEGLTTCQSMIAQNTYNFRHLLVNMTLNVPLRCACPSANQTANGFKYLLAYLITWGDNVNAIAATFSSSGAYNQSIFDANMFSNPNSLIFPFTPLLVPLKTEPNKIDLSISRPPPPPAAPTLPTTPVADDGSNSSRKWVFVGIGIGVALLILVSLSGCLVLFFPSRSTKEGNQSGPVRPNIPKEPGNNANSSSWSVSSEGARYAIGSLAHYKFEELEEATGFFGEGNRIRGSVYRGFFKGDLAAVKIMKGDVSNEINILKQINHSNIIRLSGYCVHQGNTYLVYEYAEKGSVSDLLHELSLAKATDETIPGSTSVLGWHQRVQIGYDVADALNYLHNYTTPPYIHKNLTSSNVLLDGNLRAKIANFGLARSLMDNDQDGGGMQLTRHVVGTHGCMAPEYIENGLITPKLDVFAFGVVLLELLSGREAVQHKDIEKGKEEDELLSATIVEVLGGENVREKLLEFIDPRLRNEYPLDLAYSMLQLARSCVADDLNSRPNVADVFMTLSKIQSSSLDWDPSDELDYSRSMSHGR